MVEVDSSGCDVSERGSVLFLGVEGAGKSCLTTALVRYFAEHAECGWTLRPENKTAFAFSVRQPARFAAGNFPMQTAKFHHLRWSLCYNGTPCGALDVMDYPGEVYRLAFLEPDDDPNPQELKMRQAAHADEIHELMAFMKDARQIFVLFNIEDARALDTNNEDIDAVWVTVQVLKILSQLETDPRVGLLVTQADRLVQAGEDISDARSLLVQHVPIFRPYVQDIDVMAVSAVYAENDIGGLLPLVGLLLQETEMGRKVACRWDDFLKKMRMGEPLSETEVIELNHQAELVWPSPAAQTFLKAVPTIKRYLAEQRAIDTIIRQSSSSKELLRRLDEFAIGAHLTGTKKRITQVRENAQRDCKVALGGFIVLVIIIIITVCEFAK